jgi:pyridoxal phosphate enzyme (YggS family)
VRGSAEGAARLGAVGARIARAAARAGRRPEAIRLLGAAKGQAAERVVAAVRAGLTDLGENYVQEAAAKQQKVRASLEGCALEPLRWHLIGRLQRNKARAAVRVFDAIHSLDRAALGDALEARAAEAGRRLAVLIEVNLSGEPQKAGAPAEDVPGLLAASAAWPHLELCGLMTLPAADPDPERARPAFARLRRLRDELAAGPGGAGLRELSMGMSADFEVAVEEGATIVRVGTALFGPRPG